MYKTAAQDSIPVNKYPPKLTLYGWLKNRLIDVTAFVANSMQEFEIYGHCMQLGWGQEKRDGVLSNTKDSLGTKPGLKQCEKVRDVYTTSFFYNSMLFTWGRNNNLPTEGSVFCLD